MDDDKERVSSQDAATNGLLIAQDHDGRRRSSVSSARSDISTHTILEDNPNFQPPKIERHRTERAKVRITSRWACLLGFIFGPSRVEKYCVVTLDKPDMNSGYGKAFDDEHCPFFKTLSVISRHDDRRRIEERCAFDTMSLVGNIVSLKFATRLGYQVDEFKRLEHSERSAQSSSGHLLKPMGAVYLSWYHNTSPQYTNMRFLVVDDFHYDLLIGAETIYRHNMMSPPTFATHTKPGDEKLQDLLTQHSRIATRRDALKKAHKANPNNDKTKEDWEKTKSLWSLKNLQIEERRLQIALDDDPQNSEKKKLVKQKQADIKKFIEKNGSENDLDTEYKPPLESPIKVVVQTPTGLTGRSTGHSITSKDASSIANGARL